MVAAPIATAMPSGPSRGTSHKARPSHKAIAMQALSTGRMRWPIISTIAEAGPTIASTARAPTRMKSRGKAPCASGR